MKDPVALRRKKRIYLALFVSAIVTLSGALYYLVYAPQLSELRALKGEVEMKQREFAREVEAQSVAVNTGKEEVARWNRKIRELNMRLPDREDFEALLLDVGKLARRNRLKEFRLAVKSGEKDETDNRQGGVRGASGTVYISDGGTEKDRVGVEEEKDLPVGSVNLEISFNSGYREMAYFVKGLSGTMRAMNIEDLTLLSEGRVMKASMDLRAYFRRDSEKNEGR